MFKRIAAGDLFGEGRNFKNESDDSNSQSESSDQESEASGTRRYVIL